MSVQALLKEKRIKLQKVATLENVGDMGTKLLVADRLADLDGQIGKTSASHGKASEGARNQDPARSDASDRRPTSGVCYRNRG